MMAMNAVAFDDVRYTIMSYNNNDHQIARWMNGQLVHYGAYTPAAYDIQAAQYLYGANTTTEFGATTYPLPIHATRSVNLRYGRD